MISKILALSNSRVPGRFECTIGGERRLVLRLRFLSSCSTPRSISSFRMSFPCGFALELTVEEIGDVYGCSHSAILPYLWSVDKGRRELAVVRFGLRAMPVEREILRYA